MIACTNLQPQHGYIYLRLHFVVHTPTYQFFIIFAHIFIIYHVMYCDELNYSQLKHISQHKKQGHCGRYIATGTHKRLIKCTYKKNYIHT